MNSTTYKISVEGLNLHHVLAFFEKQKIPVTNLVREGDHRLVLSLKKADFVKFKKSNLYRAYKVEILSKSGPEKLVRALCKNIGLVVGIVFVLSMTINLTSHVYAIKIIDPSHICQNQENCIFLPENQAKILHFLEENGVKKGMSFGSVPPSRDIEKLLMKNFDGISGASLERRGVNLYLTIKEAELPAPSIDLVASRNGIVVSLEVVSGKPNVKIGDIVLMGDTLVEPDGDAPVTATVVIRTFYHEITIYNEEQITYRPTGRVATKRSFKFDLFGISEKEPQSPYKLYKSQVKTNYVFYNLFLPLVTKTTTFYELEEVQEIVPYAEVEKSLKGELEAKTRQTLSPLAEEKNVTFAEYKEGSRVRLDCYIEAYLTEKK